jgi:uncharacterized protein YjbI with pentapeptide repeats
MPTGGGRTVMLVTSNGERSRSIGRWARWLAAAISLGIMIYLGIVIHQLVWHVPVVLARQNTNPSVESAYISGVATLLGVGATAFVAIAALWWSYSTNRATLNAAKESTDATVRAARETNQATIDAAREAQFPDRYSKAIELLGFANLDVRIGGIYALEGIAVDYATHHPTVMELLAAFIRGHSGKPWPVPESDGAPVPESRTRPDVQAALTVIVRRDARHDRQPTNLTDAILIGADVGTRDTYVGFRADLTGANLTGANLTRADLTEANLSPWVRAPAGDSMGAASYRARLTGANLTDANLTRANLSYATLTDANLTGAKLVRTNLTKAIVNGADLTRALLPGADLTGARLVRANLIDAFLGPPYLAPAKLIRADLTDPPDLYLLGANLAGADLTDANLTRANLSYANLTGATLTGADLTGANLAGAFLAADSVVPAGWQRDPDSGRLERNTGPGEATTN